MKHNLLKLTLLVFSTAGLSQAATLFFEGIGDLTPVGNYYNGGPGGNLGIVFGSGAYALVDQDAGGNGSFANEPSANTAMFWDSASFSIVMNVLGGFGGPLSFYHSSDGTLTVSIFDGLDGAGILLRTQGFAAQSNNNCGGDPTGEYCNWTPVSMSFVGTGRSVVFARPSFTASGIDNVTLDNLNEVPEPSTLVLSGLGLALAAAVRARAR